MQNSVPDVLLVSDEDILSEDNFDALRMHFLAAPTECAPIGAKSPHPQHLSVVSLGTYVRRHGFTPAVLDNITRIPESRRRFRRLLLDRVPIVGISTSLLMEKISVERIVREVRTLNPEAFVILGGPTAEQEPEVAALADAVVKGDGERTLLEVLSALREGGSLEKVPNLILNLSGRLHHTPSRANIEPNDIPPPDWELLDIRPSLCYPIEASKGCRYNCAFCSYANLANQKMKDVGLVVGEMERNRERYGIRMLRFMDSNLTSWPEHVGRLCDEIVARGLDLQWSCLSRVDAMAKNPRMLEKMRKAGCVALNAGIESGDDGVLRAMRKGYDGKTVVDGVRRAKEAGLIVTGNFIVGFPGETRETVDRTLEVIGRAEPDGVSFSLFWMHKNSTAAVWTDRERWGIEGVGTRWRHATMDSEEAKTELERAMWAVMEMPGTVISNGFVLTGLVGCGLSEGEALAYFAAIRDYHRGKRVGNAALQGKSAARIRSIRERARGHLSRFYEVRTGIAA